MRHEQHDRLSLEVARRIAAELPRRPEWIAAARANLDRWSVRNQGSARLVGCYDEWRAILSRPIEDICAILIAPTDEGQRLRQNSPFVGVLPVSIVEEIRTRLAHGQNAA